MKSEDRHEQRKRQTLYSLAFRGAAKGLNEGGPIEEMATILMRKALHAQVKSLLENMELGEGKELNERIYAAMDKFAMHDVPRSVIRSIVDPQPDAEHAAIAAGAALFVVCRNMGFGDSAPITILGCDIDKPDPGVQGRIESIVNGLEKRKRRAFVAAAKRGTVVVAEYHVPFGVDQQRNLVVSVLSRCRSTPSANARRRIGAAYANLLAKAAEARGGFGTDWCSN